jgi:hypothetical protein
VIDSRRHVVCLLGQDLDFERLQWCARDAGGEGFEVDLEFSEHERDPRMAEAFRACADRVVPSFDDADWAAVDAHTDVLYLLSPAYTDVTAVDVASRTLAATAALLRDGATAAKGECSGIAHGHDRWLELADLAQGATVDSDLVSALHLAWVRRPIGDAGWLYTCGMHLLGQPDIEYPDDDPDWLEWMDALALYLLAELPADGMRSGEGFRLSADGPRRVLRHTPCDRYDADDLFFNPYGYWRLTPDTATG